MSRRAPLRLPDEPNLEVLPARVWGVLIGLGLAATASLFGLLGIITGWEIVPGMPYLYNGLLALALILCWLMVPVAWRQLPGQLPVFHPRILCILSTLSRGTSDSWLNESPE